MKMFGRFSRWLNKLWKKEKLINIPFFFSSGLDVVGLLTKLGVGDSFIQWLKTKLASKSSSFAVNFVIAYAVHKIFLPLRIGMTLTCSPLIVRYLRKIGFIKPVQKGTGAGKKPN